MSKTYRVTVYSQEDPDEIYTEIEFKIAARAAAEWMLWVSRGYRAQLDVI